jgi:tRNA U34 5-carboxymethylaminomethyl modifying GTPase MnmE/TrmE
VAADLYTARRELHAAYEQEDRGAVVAQVFSRFCVGK